MKKNNGIALALFGQVRCAILALLFFHSDESYYMRQIVRMTGAAHGAIQRELAHLVQTGLIVRNKHGMEVFYQANTLSPIFPEVRGLIIKTAGAVEVLRVALAPVAERIEVAFIYGSVAKGTEKATSDVDIMVIGEVGFNEIVAILMPAEEQLHREVNPSVFTSAEIAQGVAHRQHFITSVLQETKVFLIGGEHDLTRLVSGLRADRAANE